MDKILPDGFISLIKKPVNKNIPLGFHLLRPGGSNGQLTAYTACESKTHQTNFYATGAYYKPIANLPLFADSND